MSDMNLNLSPVVCMQDTFARARTRVVISPIRTPYRYGTNGGPAFFQISNNIRYILIYCIRALRPIFKLHNVLKACRFINMQY